MLTLLYAKRLLNFKGLNFTARLAYYYAVMDVADNPIFELSNKKVKNLNTVKHKDLSKGTVRPNSPCNQC